ncbi:MAG: class I SAM-dependent methyltransferase [Gallionellaceae bacterium]|nr:class I SAM-dependent methyltransferase [Gallionellaceae bacterium]
MRLDDHNSLRGHIRPEAFDPRQRQAWRESRYQEALSAHHAYSTDRPALLRVMSDLLRAFVRDTEAIRPGQRARILDVGSGTGEVSGQLLAALTPLAGIEYCGIDKDRAVLESGHARLRAATNPDAVISLAAADFSRADWDEGLGDRHFHMIWLVHSGYYLEQGHAEFLTTLERLADPDGFMVLIHNPEGHAPFRHAAEQLDLPFQAIRYERRIVPPTVSAEVFETLATDPGSLDEFSECFAAWPEARALRLMLEFYLPEYPLEALSGPDRAAYVGHWRQHLASASGRFANQHEMLVMWPRRHGQRARAWMQSYFKEHDKP